MVRLHYFKNQRYSKLKKQCEKEERLFVHGHRIPCGRQITVFQPRTAASSRVETTSGRLEVLFIIVLVTQRIYSRLHGFTEHFVFTAFDMHRFTTLAKKHEGTTRESHDTLNTIAGYPRGTLTSQVCSVSYLVYPCGYNGL